MKTNCRTKKINNMPGFDRTGPMGQGSMTGRRLGKCNPDNKANDNQQEDVNFPRGFGRGIGKKIGRGLGLGRGPRKGGGRGFGRANM
jgi:hypothetical protein